MTRIVAGSHGGRRLRTPPGAATRPTSERVRAALANTLAARDAIADQVVLDLYAGSGALGLELLSRGARRAVMVERDRAALTALRANVAELGSAAEVLAADVRTYRGQGGPFGLVVADPPYEVADDELTAVLTALVEADGLTRGAVLVVERGVRGGPLRWPEPLVDDGHRRYGDTLLCYGRGP